MNNNLLRTSAMFLALTLGAAIPHAVQAIPIYIDESGEGISPTVSSPSSLFQGASVTSIGTEAWEIVLQVAGEFASFTGINRGLELLEPETGNLSDSFSVLRANWFTGSGGPTTITSQLFSDDELGNLAARSPRCPNNPLCVTAVEDGTFQLAMEGITTTAGSFDIYLKSDLEVNNVDESATFAMFLIGVIGLWLSQSVSAHKTNCLLEQWS